MEKRTIKGKVTPASTWKKENISEASSLKVELSEDCSGCSETRLAISRDLMAGLLAGEWRGTPKELARYAIECADALIEEINKKD